MRTTTTNEVRVSYYVLLNGSNSLFDYGKCCFSVKTVSVSDTIVRKRKESEGGDWGRGW